MLNRISQCITQYLIRIHKVEEEDEDLINYGLQLIISNLTALLVVLIVGLIFQCFFEVVLFVMIFYVIRRYGGGYHASTMFRCMMVTLYVDLLLVWLLSFKIPIDYLWIFWIGIIMSYILCVPQNSDIKAEDYGRYKIINLFLLLIGAIMMIICFYGELHDIGVILTYAYLVTALANIWEWRKKDD